MDTAMPLSRFQSAATVAKVREQLARVHELVQRRAVLDTAVANLAMTLDIRPSEAAERLKQMAKNSGVQLLEAARMVQPPPPDDSPLPEVADWVHPLLETFHDSAAWLCPVRDSVGRVVGFRVLAANSHCTTPAGQRCDMIGRRLMSISPGIGTSGLLEDYIRAYESGEPYFRRAIEHLEISGERFWPVTMTVRAARVIDGMLLSWCVLDEKDMLISGWSRAQRLAELGWGEWDLATWQVIWTPQMYDMLGLDPGEKPIALEDLPKLAVPEDLAAVEDLIDTLLECRESAETEFRVRHRHGTRHLCVVAEPLLDSEGLPVKLRFLVQDVTRNRRRERSMARIQAQAVRQEERALEQQRVSEHLQAVILPNRQRFMHLPGLAVGVRYLPAEELARLGGDFFKARRLGEDKVLLAVGDAMGHGLAAAGLMLQLRAGLAGLAYTGEPANRLVTFLNSVIMDFAQSVNPVTGTMVVGHFDATKRTFVWANAGHLAPMLVRDGCARLLDGASGPLLGAFEADYELNTTELEAGDLLLLYTDGIIEKRGRDLDVGIQVLLSTAQDCYQEDPEAVIDCILERLDGGHVEDDVCILAARVL
ncbi:PP2C family protein-serine/threonine phosphatase [Nonomuraea bangladeshensis]|uniref:PP2C family protein-serine/threonine phosphatase n=1 Tax=Nonomuraea bangladeshensis TaxID=404385 RepID=UPI003F49474C